MSRRIIENKQDHKLKVTEKVRVWSLVAGSIGNTCVFSGRVDVHGSCVEAGAGGDGGQVFVIWCFICSNYFQSK